MLLCEPGSSVGTATDYWLDGPGSNPGEDEMCSTLHYAKCSQCKGTNAMKWTAVYVAVRFATPSVVCSCLSTERNFK